MEISEDNISTRTRTKNAKGFVLIELLTAVAIIAILIGLLLPAIQRKREEVAAEEAKGKVQQAAHAANYYRNRTGEYPQSLTQLVQFVTSHPSPGISIDPRLASGRVNGYLYEIVGIAAFPDVCIIEAEPEFPGITGSRTVTANLSTRAGGEVISDFLTPGSDEAREQMFNRIRVKAAETVVELLKLDSSASSDARSFVYEQIEWVFLATLMNTDSDGRITINEIRNYDPNMDSALKGPLSEFMDYTDDACMWGVLSEAARTNTGVSASEIELARGEQPPLFSYDGLGILTKIMVASDGLGTTWPYGLKALEDAEAAEANGDLRERDKAVNRYSMLVKAEIGRTITRGNANTLLNLLDVVTDETTGVPML